MAKKNKETANKKEKKTSSFFSNLNADSTIEYGFAEKNPKSKWAKWTIVGLIGAATVTGIAVPWSLSSCTVSLTKPFNNSDVMYTYIDPITNKVISVTYKEFSTRIEKVQTTTTILDKWDDVFYRNVLKTLYDEEREAFLKFSAIYKKLHGTAPQISSFGADLGTSFKDIEKAQRKILEDNKKSFQKAVDGSSWLDLWIQELQTNSIYGPQSAEKTTTVETLESKALDYMITQQIKSSALARFQGASISSESWTYQDYNFANTSNPSNDEYTKYKNNDGEEVAITTKEAVDVWKAYLTKDVNVVQPKNITTENSKKISVFETKSYSTEYRNPVLNDKLLNLINKNFKLGLVSSVKLLGLTPASSKTSSFGITNESLKSLFTAQVTNGTTATQNFIPFSQLSKFTGANTINISTDTTNASYIQNAKDNLLYSTMNTTSTDSDESKDDSETNTSVPTLGSSKLSEITSLLTTVGDESKTSLNVFNFFAFMSSNTGATSSDGDQTELFSINELNPFTEFMKILLTIATSSTNEMNLSVGQAFVKANWEGLNYGTTVASSTLKQFVKVLNDNINPTTFEFENRINSLDYNQLLSNAIDLLTESDRTFLGNLLNCILMGDSSQIKTNYKENQLMMNQVGYWSLYELSKPSSSNNNIGTYLHIGKSEVTVFSKNFNTPTLEEIKQMVISDLNQTINAFSDSSSESSSSTTPTLYYDVSSVFGKLNNDNLIISFLLDDPENENTFKLAIQNYLDKDNSSSSEESQATIIFEQFKEYVNLEVSSTFASNNLNVVNSIPTSIKELIESNLFYDFAIVVDSVTGEELAAFQTQTKYGLDSIAKGEGQINNLFIKNLLKALEISSNVVLKGDK